MDEVIAKQTAQGLQGIGNILGGANQYAASRESAQTIVENMAKLHERELAGWNYLRRVMKEIPPTTEQEPALWELLCRARRERY